MAGDDALGLFQAMRPQAPSPSPDIRAARSGVQGAPDLHSLAMVPGTPGYNARIPRPPCYLCGEDHVPNMTYNHDWTAEPVHDEPVSATAIMHRSAPPAPAVYDPREATPQLPSHRVALYVGRGDTYVVAVEQSPDWDAVHTFKVEPTAVLPLIQMARALGTKVSDKTGGDLLMLEQEAADGRRKPEKNYDRGAQGAGDREPRRQGSGADRPQEDQPSEDQPEPG